MKCTCDKRPTMIKVTDGNGNFWWRCPVCHKEVGKPKNESND